MALTVESGIPVVKAAAWGWTHEERREFIGLLSGAAAAWPFVARAQQPDMRRIGMPISLAGDDPEGHSRVAALHQGLQQWGGTVGGNVRVDIRWGAGIF